MQHTFRHDSEKDGASITPAPQGCLTNAGSHGAGQVFVRISADAKIGRAAVYYRDTFASHRAVSEIWGLSEFNSLSHG